MNIVSDNLANSMFTACSFGYCIYSSGDRKKQEFHFGRTGRARDDAKVDENSVYDLASLTKPLVVSLSVMTLCETRQLSVTDTLYRFFGAKARELSRISINQLLNHCSGLVAHRPYFDELLKFEQNERKDTLFKLIFSEQPFENPACIYSDLGYMLLGKIIEKITGQGLSHYWRKNIAEPLGLDEQIFFPESLNISASSFVSTGQCQWSGQELSGLVNDDNCRSIGGVAGHAGLFGSLKGVLRLLEALFINYEGQPSPLSFQLKKYLSGSNKTGDRWLFGFDTPESMNSTSGRYFSRDSVGHLGFTGTSFWMDLRRDLAIVVLTNRVLTNGSIEKMRLFRQRVHDCGMEYLLSLKVQPKNKNP